MTAAPVRVPSWRRAEQLYRRHTILQLEALAKVDTCDDVKLALVWRRLWECGVKVPKLTDVTPEGLKRAIAQCTRLLQRMGCHLCRGAFTAEEAARITSRFALCAACTKPGQRSWRNNRERLPIGFVDPKAYASQFDDGKAEADRAEATANADRQWDAYRREQERPGDGRLAAPKGPDFQTWLSKHEEET